MIRRLSYGTRLTIAYTAIVALALIVFTFIAYAAVQFTLANQLTSRLQTVASAVHSVPDIRRGRIVFDPDDRAQFLELLAQNHVNGLTASSDGRLVLSNLARPPHEFIALAERRSDETGDLTIGGDTLAYRTAPIWQGSRQYGAVVVWSSRALNSDVARTTLLTLIGATLAVLIAAALAGRMLVQRMLQPVADLSAMISEIEASDLSERLAWNGPDDELGRLCTTFDRLLDRLETAFEQQRRFTADASHELRTPLSVMRAELELALARARDGDDYRTILQRLRIETERLETLTESLLWAARHDAGKVSANAVVVASLIERAIARVSPLAPGLHFDVHGSAAAAVRADAPVLERAFVAVLDNARRFSPPGGTVRCEIAVRGTSLEVRIVDDGPGFSDAGLRHATERFWRDDPARSGSGTGLGLAIAAAIVERHGGTISLDNHEHHGASVGITLPLAGFQTPAPEMTPTATV